MFPLITFNETKDTLIIEIKQRQKGILIFGLSFIGVIFLGAGFLFIYEWWIDANKLPLFLTLFLLSISIVFFYIGKTYLNKIFNSEIIKITKDTIEIKSKTTFGSKETIIEKNSIVDIIYVIEDDFTNQQINTESIDDTEISILGKEIKLLVDDGRLIIINDNMQFRFGKDIYEEDAYEIIMRIKKQISL